MGEFKEILKEFMYMLIEAKCKWCEDVYRTHCDYCKTCHWNLEDGCANEKCGGGHENGNS